MQKAYLAAAAVIIAAVVAAIVGSLGAALITRSLQRERNRQDREAQWRSHAVELTKLDADRLSKSAKPNERLRPLILTFLANYRDLQELGEKTPAELYKDIISKRISKPPDVPTQVLGGTRGAVVSCSGYELYGHPRIFLVLQPEEIATCPYCSRQYALPVMI